MFARSEEIGVRSSWLASAIRWRWACTERSSASSVAVEALRQTRQLVAALDLQAL